MGAGARSLRWSYVTRSVFHVKPKHLPAVAVGTASALLLVIGGCGDRDVPEDTPPEFTPESAFNVAYYRNPVVFQCHGPNMVYVYRDTVAVADDDPRCLEAFFDQLPEEPPG